MATKLADARKSLIKAKTAAQQRLREIEDERKEIRASIKSLDAALRALDRSATGRNANASSQDDDVAHEGHPTVNVNPE